MPPPEDRPKEAAREGGSRIWLLIFRAFYYVVSPLELKTDRLVRRLVLADFVFLIYLSMMAYDSRVVLAAIVAGNVVGAVIGLLFSVPKRATTTDGKQSPAPGGPRIGIIANTSLEEVSEWLTKTIIGAGLVSWSPILQSLDRSGGYVGAALITGNDTLALAGGVAIILASVSLGALIGYLWFARHWPSELAASDTETMNRFITGGQVQEKSDVAPNEPILPATPAPPVSPERPVDAAPQMDSGAADGKGAVGLVAAAQPDIAQERARLASLLRAAAEMKYARMRSAPLVHEDWAKGMFGGSPRVTNSFGTRELSASVQKIEGVFKVDLQVRAQPAPLTDAIFFLHNTFANPTPTVGFDDNEIARLSVRAWGAFTVGVLLDDGTTELELDLAQLDSAPFEFRNR